MGDIRNRGNREGERGKEGQRDRVGDRRSRGNREG